MLTEDIFDSAGVLRLHVNYRNNTGTRTIVHNRRNKLHVAIYRYHLQLSNVPVATIPKNVCEFKRYCKNVCAAASTKQSIWLVKCLSWKHPTGVVLFDQSCAAVKADADASATTVTAMSFTMDESKEEANSALCISTRIKRKGYRINKATVLFSKRHTREKCRYIPGTLG